VAAKDPAIDARKSAILRQVISEHIQTGQPIGSAHVVHNAEIEVSAATVRSDMAVLEREGYLTHPHTSAGRIPTDKGYRYFVDHLDETNTLDPASEEQVKVFFERAHGELERMLRDTSRLLSQLTDYASVVVGPTHEMLSIRSSLLTRLGPRTALLVVVLSNGVVEKRSLELDEAVTDTEVEQANVALREHLPGQTLGRPAPMRFSGARTVDRIVQSCYAVLPAIPPYDSSAEDVYVGGTSHMADQFAAAATVREVLAILEQSFVVVSLISNLLAQGRQVAIGAESGLPSLAECSLVVAPYEVDNEFVGTIGVLGPTRMNYPQALATVAVVSQRLSHELSGN
jgi:heat-inducible transcriptional repressor